MALIGYNEETDLTDYASARGIVLKLPTAQTLQLALDYLELQRWAGVKTDPAQENDFPRNGATVVPGQIARAQLVAAVIYDGGGDPMGAVGPRVLSQTVVGAVSVSFSDKGNQTTSYPKLESLIAPWLDVSSSLTQFKVSRA